MTIGKKIRQLRRDLGLSQQALSDKLGVTAQAVSKWENETSLPDISILPSMASIFGVQIDDLFEYSKDKEYEKISNMIELK
ncbi:MAG: helix-turn-helix transcriptional regulator, partial [Spirochaetales bacterium]|nr:helix-turn-helix transcriptional regulator [Spirochaetales bacterium]